MSNTNKFAALVSDAGNWDKVTEVDNEEQYRQDLQGRTELDWYDTEEAAQEAINEYRKEQADHYAQFAD